VATSDPRNSNAIATIVNSPALEIVIGNRDLLRVEAISGPLMLGEPAVNVFKRWKFVPATVRDLPVETTCTVYLVFKPPF
jgi:hypothetical protein